MNRINVEKISQLQKEASHIRNVCILAHVDHGKTTLADNLISSNGIISPKLAGKLRYLDSREDEQLKGITMKSSAISLHYTSQEKKEYLVNLIDSPGHIDFYSEVSTVVRLCDGAIILVDAVEGICPQTQAVLRQAWIQNIKPVLVLNKIDRLILELKLSPEEAETRLTQLFEQINAVTGELFTSDVLSKSSQEDTQKKNCDERRNQFDLNEWDTGIEDLDDSMLYFSPDQGNVVFSSATDGWGFRISTFASLYAKKLGVSSEVLNKTLWGDFYLDPKSKSVKKGAKSKGKKTLFNQLILENMWKIYDCVCNKKDELLVKKIVETLGLKVVVKTTDPKKTLQSIFSQWLPLSSSVLEMVCQLLPSPLSISEERVLTFLKGNASIDSVPAETMSLKEDLSKCSSSDCSPTIIFISKMFPFETKFLPQNQPKPLTAEERAAKREMILKKRLEGNANGFVSSSIVPLDSEENQTETNNEKSTIFVAFARIFSGKIKKGQWLYVFGPRHDPNNLLNIDLKDEDKLKNLNVAKIQVKDLYLLMGRDLECLDEVPAGNIFGVGGLDELVFKSASLSDSLFCPSFTDLFQEVSPIVRVAVEPKYTNDLDKLVNGLKLLNQSDPCVEVFVQETGEHVLVTSGEVHLDKCLDDLRQRFALIDITVSSPTVPFRETVVLPPTIDRVNENIADQLSNMKLKSDQEESLSANLISDSWHLTIRAMPLSEGVIKVLGDNSQLLKLCARKISSGKIEAIDHKTSSALTNLKEKLSKLFQEEMGVDCSFMEHLWSVDPRRICSNILINQVPGYDRPSFWDLAKCCDNSLMERLRSMDRSIINGFEVASNSGPLCEEPMFGVCFIVENWIEVGKKQDSGQLENEYDQNGESDDKVGGEDGTETEETISDLRAPLQFKGSLISCMKECCKRAFQAQPQRLMWAMYTCVIQTTAEVLGKMYGVLGKRHGRILSEEMKEGSTSFQISAVLPVIESFGFAEEFRKKTSGLAMPQLKFSHWEVIDIDPFWVPTTDEEYTHFGEKADSENVARKHMNDIRRRKGLRTTEKLVEFGEKQRTLKKNK